MGNSIAPAFDLKLRVLNVDYITGCVFGTQYHYNILTLRNCVIVVLKANKGCLFYALVEGGSSSISVLGGIFKI